MKKSFIKNMAGFATGLYVAGFAAGNASALALTPRLLSFFNWRMILLVYALLPVIITIIWWLFIPEETSLQTENHQPVQFRKIFMDRSLWVLLILVIAAMGGYDTLATWVPKVIEMKKMNPSFAMLLPIGFFFSGPIIGLLSDRFISRKALLIVMGFATLFSVLGIRSNHLILFNTSLFFAGFCPNSVLTMSLTIPASQERYASTVGGVVGVISSLGNIGTLLLPVVFGSLMDITGTYQMSLLFIALFSGSVFILSSQSKYF